jgi:dinuclear metal center YbgI/SA1388 family protein
MKIKDITTFLEKLAPLEYSLDWDNCGLQVGNLKNSLDKIGIALTPTVEIIEKAIENNCNLLITHHPLIFKPIKSIDINTPIGKMINLALKKDLCIYTLHTNFDSASTGLNYNIAKGLGLDNIEVLSITGSLDNYKLVTFIPEEYTLRVVNALSEAGAGNIGKFSHRSYITAGIATYSDSNNHLINLDELDKESEDRLEITVPKNKLNNVINVLKENHPYEDVLFDIYKIEDKSQSYGIGTIGTFYTPFRLIEVINMLKRNLNIPNLSFVGNPDKLIERVAICTGSGASLMKDAKRNNADLFITGDIKYHDAIDAKEIDLALIDATHYFTEIIAVPFLSKYLKNNFSNDLDIVELIENNPFSYI